MPILIVMNNETNNKTSIKEQLLDIIKVKDTRICLAADVDSVEELLEIADTLGPYICLLKLHYDIIPDFHEKKCGDKLIELRKKHNFLIWEDRKYADIGSIMERQIRLNVIPWANIVSVHALSGLESLKAIPNEIGIIAIGELSSYENLIDSNYTNKAVGMCNQLENLVGFVGQRDFRLEQDSLMFVPGIGRKSGDGKGQRYSSIMDKSFADVFVIGRSILNSKERIATIKEFISEAREVKENYTIY